MPTRVLLSFKNMIFTIKHLQDSCSFSFCNSSTIFKYSHIFCSKTQKKSFRIEGYWRKSQKKSTLKFCTKSLISKDLNRKWLIGTKLIRKFLPSHIKFSILQLLKCNKRIFLIFNFTVVSKFFAAKSTIPFKLSAGIEKVFAIFFIHFTSKLDCRQNKKEFHLAIENSTKNTIASFLYQYRTIFLIILEYFYNIMKKILSLINDTLLQRKFYLHYLEKFWV